MRNQKCMAEKKEARSHQAGGKSAESEDANGVFVIVTFIQHGHYLLAFVLKSCVTISDS